MRDRGERHTGDKAFETLLGTDKGLDFFSGKAFDCMFAGSTPTTVFVGHKYQLNEHYSCKKGYTNED